MGSHYGALPAHAGMWRAAEDTAERSDGPAGGGADGARGARAGRDARHDRHLHARPGITRGRGAEAIYAEEVAHVAYGSKWFHFLCGRHDLDPKEVFHDLVRRYFHGALKPPFNEEKRAEAGLPPDFLLAAGR